MNRSLVPLLLAWAACGRNTQSNQIKVGSKEFTESVILGEIATGVLEGTGQTAVHLKGLGGSRVLWDALRSGQVDIYPEYTGTLAFELLPTADYQAALERIGLRMLPSLGFNNTYALGLKRKLADTLGVSTLSDLGHHPELRLGLSNEFIDRGDGWKTLRERYHLPQKDVRGMEHELAYRAIESGAVDVIDLYSTDGDARMHDLVILRDNLHHFPEYQAVYLYRSQLEQTAPLAIKALRSLSGHISDSEMIEMNAQAKFGKVPESEVAAKFFERQQIRSRTVHRESRWELFLTHTVDHLFLVGTSLLAAVVVAIPLGILSAKRRRLGQVVLALTGLVQTIPSLALLVFMIPLLGIGARPAIAALFFYSLLPMVRNTHAGLTGIPVGILQSAQALGLPAWTRLWKVELPIASPSILAGVKTSAVINVGTATLGALVGAGGYGQPILTGIRLDDLGLILQGALPAAGLALLVQGAFELLERAVVPLGLRLR